MKNTIMRLFFASMLVISLAFVLASCGEEPHVHNWGEWQPVEGEEATCVDDGKEFRVCADDPTHTETRDVEATGKHNLAGEYISAPGGHWQLCSVCGEREEVLAHESAGPATTESAELCKHCGYELSPKLNILTNKKIIFIGNSHFFYSDVVLEKAADNTKLSNRQNDKGTFYDIAVANGVAGLKVTNWTYGNHTFKDFFSGDCQANRDCGNGYNHLKDLTDLNYDYVVLQHGPDSADVREEWMEFAMNMFKEANPNVKFILAVPTRTHDGTTSSAKLLHKIKEYETKYNMIVVDWGGLIYDIYTGKVSVPGAKFDHEKDTYVVARSEDDGYHPSLLSGYITSLMIYCAITGEKAVGQSWDYYTDTRIENFLKWKYVIRDTNFVEILNSEPDMLGIQKLIDRYLEEKYYLQYEAPAPQS